MTIPPQPPLSFSTQNPLSSKTMYDSRTQFSHHKNENYGNLVAMKFGYNDRKLAQKCENYRECYGEGVQFTANNHQEAMESDDSGVCSPPLWKNIPSPPKSASQPLLSHHNYRSLSPNSRLQAIARGQFELMEMVKNMPESSYELSLKDIVEHHRLETQIPQVERSNNNNQTLQQRGVVKVKWLERKKINDSMMKSNSFENKGLFLKMVFPISLKSKKKKNFEKNITGKVSPKPEVIKDCEERDWWKKRFTGSSDSDSSRTRDNSGSTGSSSGGSSSGRSHSGGTGRKSNGIPSSGCWPFFQTRRSKSAD